MRTILAAAFMLAAGPLYAAHTWVDESCGAALIREDDGSYSYLAATSEPPATRCTVDATRLTCGGDILTIEVVSADTVLVDGVRLQTATDENGLCD